MKATVIRGGQEREIEARELVIGDIVRKMPATDKSCEFSFAELIT